MASEVIQNYDFEDAIQGNTYEGVIFNLPQEVSFALAGAEIYMQIRRKPEGNVIAEFSTLNHGMEITGDYSYAFPAQIIELVPDLYYYDILIVFADGRRETYVGGKWRVLNAITRKP